MTIKEAIIKSLDELGKLANSIEICDYILANGYYEFGGKTPAATISAQLGDFIRNGDTRVKRIKQSNGTYSYYLTKNEQNIELKILNDETGSQISKTTTVTEPKTYKEKALHLLLSSYLSITKIYSKTIHHEESIKKDDNKTWTHPDMVGIEFLNLQSKTSQKFLKTIKRVDTFRLSAYELKKEINTDNELKKAFFQAVSNSSWANYGYLVAFEFSDSLNEEMKRLNQSFGIGIIELNAYPYQSKVLFPSVYRDLDFRTIDKLCMMNQNFEKFIKETEKLITAEEEFISGAMKEFEEFCDKYFKNDTEIENYCKEKHIPTNEG